MPKPAEWIPLYLPEVPASLEWLKISPINCLVVATLTEELSKRANRLGLDVVAMDGLDSQVNLLRQAKWPSVSSPSSPSGAISSGPTGSPWVDSNAWLSDLAHVKSPDKPAWIVSHPPTDAGMLRSEAYMLAVIDAAIYGSRWLVSLDPALR